MLDTYKFRCSSIGKLMTKPKTLEEGPLSVGAKTYIRSLAAQEIFGTDFEFSSKETDKGNMVEQDSIDLINQVYNLRLKKNSERRSDDWFTGECDLFDRFARRGHDAKSSWSLATFPISVSDCIDKLYEYQMRGYMRLWDADEWQVDYCMVNTPEVLLRGYEPLSLHVVGHIPPHLRITSWTIRRDLTIEAAMVEKVKHARLYFAEVIQEFTRTHIDRGPRAAIQAAPPFDITPAAPRVAAPLPASIF